MGGPGRDDEQAPWWRRPRSWPWRLTASVVLAGLVTAGAAAALAGEVGELSRVSAVDRLFPTGPTDDRVAVVEIDPASIAAVGEGWPWPRSVHAALIDALADAGAAAVGYDVVFADPDPDDDVLAQAVADAGNVVLVETAALEPEPPRGLLEATAPRSAPVDALAEAARSVAHAAVWEDADSVVRGVPLVIEDARRFVPALALALVAVLDDADASTPTLRPEGLQLGDRYHPAPASALRVLDLNWTARLRWRAQARPAVSAIDVLEGRADPALLRGAIVLVGPTDPLLGDFHQTPTERGGGGAPGVYVHANAVNTVLTGWYRAPLDDRLTLIAVAVLSVVVAALVLWLPLRVGVLAVLAVAAGYLVWADARFEAARSTDLVYPAAAIAATAVAAVVLRYVTEVRERRRVAALFGQYVPPAVARELVDSGRTQAAVTGQRVEVTVFFCDLRGFTATAATLQPPQVRTLLNRYYEHVTGQVLAHGGTVMQYVGDEVFAVFGAPLEQPDHAQRALACALAVRDGLDDLNARLEDDGLPPIAYGTGINSGEVVAAHVGSFHRQYAVVGDTVNVGSRLCGLAGASEITLSEDVRVRLDHPPPLTPRGPVAMKGVERDVPVYEVDDDGGREATAAPRR